MPKSTLLVAFENVVKQFNACSKKEDYDNLRSLLHPNIIINKVDDLTPPTAFATLDKVITYLKETQTGKFPRLNQKSTEETPSDSSQSTLAQVSGLAGYKDKSSDTSELSVRYFFTFTRERPNDVWLLSNACASAAKVA